jgi:hydrogenase maturation protein HypF
VQGVGFRPFVYRLADEMGLDGWVVNDNRGVTLEVHDHRVVVTRRIPRLRDSSQR